MNNLFGEPSGFRLARLELFNWGTFDGKIWPMTPDGQTAVLTGANGSGKSTLVDALLTLLVEGRRRNYNLASGAGSSRERSERTYVVGQYSRSRGETAVDARSNALRGSDTHTVLLAVFTDAAAQRVVTLAQVLWISNSNSVEKRYYVAPIELTIEAHFPERLVSARDLPDEASTFKTFKEYIAAARKALGLGGRQKALDLFNQTVAVKEIASLNGFVRDHMLDPGDPQARADALRDQYRELNDAHAAIQRAAHQLEILDPLTDAAETYRRYADQIERYEAARALVPFYVAHHSRELLQAAITEAESKREAEQSKLKGIDDEIVNRRADLQDVEFAIRQDSVGQMKRELEGKIPLVEGRITPLRRAADRYDQAAKRLGLDPYRDADTFQANRTAAQAMQASAQEDIAQLEADRQERQFNLRDQVDQAKTLAEEIEYLRENRSQIPHKVASIRAEISTALGVASDELPFAGELLRVRDEETEWEGALERLLHGFAQEMLVPDHLYERVTAYVNDTDLKRRRLVYRRLTHETGKRTPESHTQYAYDKLQIHPETPHHDWLAAHLRRQFDFVCCATLDQFREERRALTRQGQIKYSTSRHEKDDRRRLDDRSRYVLGWDNAAKLRELETQLADIQHTVEQLQAAVAEIDQQLDRRRRDVTALENLLSVTAFEEIDWRAAQAELDRLRKRLAELDQQAQKLRDLESQRDTLQAEIQDLTKRRDNITGAITTYNQRITDYQQRQADAQQTLDGASDDDLDRWDRYVTILEEIDKEPLTLGTLQTRGGELDVSIGRSIANFIGFQNRATATITDAMHTFRREYPDEGASLTADIDALAAYERIHERLEQDALPQHQARFKQMLDRTVTRGVMAFKTHLDEQERAIERSIDELNRSLAQVDYGRGSHIRLIAEPSRNPEIIDFKNQLLACIPNMGDTSPEELERAYTRIKALIERFDDDPNWMLRVIDVRRWRVFAAEQIGPEGEQIDYYSDSAGKSGGQKAKLAYTILASAIAHQYGLQDALNGDRSFRFVVIDEAFSKLDDDNARYAMTLFAQLGLQLLVVTPMQQLHVIEDHVHAYHVVVNNDVGNHSRMFNLTSETYRERQREFQAEGGNR